MNKVSICAGDLGGIVYSSSGNVCRYPGRYKLDAPTFADHLDGVDRTRQPRADYFEGADQLRQSRVHDRDNTDHVQIERAKKSWTNELPLVAQTVRPQDCTSRYWLFVRTA